MHRVRAAVLGLVVALLLVGSGLALVGRVQADEAMNGHAVVGSWRLMAGGAAGTPAGDPTLATFAADGTLILSGRAVRPALPGMPFNYIHFSTGHGEWQEAGENGVTFTIVHLRVDETGTFQGSVTVSGSLELSEDGQAIDGVETFTVRNPAGDVLSAFPDALEGSRITVEPMAAVATPTS